MTRIQKIENSINTQNDMNLSKTIIEEIDNLTKTEKEKIMMKIIEKIRNNAIETNTKGAR